MLESCEVAVSSSGADDEPKHILESPGLIRPLKEAQRDAGEEEEEPTIKKVWTVCPDRWEIADVCPCKPPFRKWPNIGKGLNQSLFGEKVSKLFT